MKQLHVSGSPAFFGLGRAFAIFGLLFLFGCAAEIERANNGQFMYFTDGEGGREIITFQAYGDGVVFIGEDGKILSPKVLRGRLRGGESLLFLSTAKKRLDGFRLLKVKRPRKYVEKHHQFEEDVYRDSDYDRYSHTLQENYPDDSGEIQYQDRDNERDSRSKAKVFSEIKKHRKEKNEEEVKPVLVDPLRKKATSKEGERVVKEVKVRREAISPNEVTSNFVHKGNQYQITKKKYGYSSGICSGENHHRECLLLDMTNGSDPFVHTLKSTFAGSDEWQYERYIILHNFLNQDALGQDAKPYISRINLNSSESKLRSESASYRKALVDAELAARQKRTNQNVLEDSKKLQNRDVADPNKNTREKKNEVIRDLVDQNQNGLRDVTPKKEEKKVDKKVEDRQKLQDAQNKAREELKAKKAREAEEKARKKETPKETSTPKRETTPKREEKKVERKSTAPSNTSQKRSKSKN